MTTSAELGKTMLKRLDLYRDRWTSFGADTRILSLTDKLRPDELREFEIFEPYDDDFLEKISHDISVAEWGPNAVLFEEGTYIDLAFYVASGEVNVSLQRLAESTGTSAAPIFERMRTTVLPAVEAPDGEPSRPPDTRPMSVTRLLRQARGRPPGITFLATMDFDLKRGEVSRLGPGELFGEIGAMSGWPQSVTAATKTACRLVQIRLPALRLMKSRSKDLKDRLDELYRQRSLSAQLKQTPLFRDCPDAMIEALHEVVELVSCEPDEAVVEEGDPVDAIYLVRSGFVKLTQRLGEGQMAVSYLSKGMTLGDTEVAVAELDRWEVSARSFEYSELVKLPLDVLSELGRRYPRIHRQLWKSGVARLKEIGFTKRNIGHSEFTEVALEAGLVQGNSILAIDLDVCTRCDDCVRACEATHGGRARFVREGSRYENLLVAKSCYHCHDPVCLVGCPTGAIHRAGLSEVVEIDDEICIGCRTCAMNCPYDAIVMHDTAEVWAEDTIPVGLRGRPRLLASKCDLCSSTSHGPACVSNCPQSCAYRVGSLEEFERLLKRKERPEAGRRLELFRLGRTSARWLAGFLVALAAALGAYLLNLTTSEVRPDSAWGLSYGVGASALMLGALLLGLRRRTMAASSRYRLGPSRGWLLFHVYGGLLFLLLMLMHSGFRLPQGVVTGWLMGLSLATVASGLVGLALQKWIPRALSSGLSLEVLHDRIPDLVAEIRKRAEALAASCDEPVKTAYAKKMAPVLERPSRRAIYFIDITGGIQTRLKDFSYLRPFLSADQQARLSDLQDLFRAKLEVDAHATLQQALRLWLYTHIPVSLLLLVFLVLHLYSVWRW